MDFVIFVLGLLVFLYPLSYIWLLFKPQKKDSEKFLFIQGQPSGDFFTKLKYILICTFKVWSGNLISGLIIGVGLSPFFSNSDIVGIVIVYFFGIISLIYPIFLYNKVSKF